MIFVMCVYMLKKLIYVFPIREKKVSKSFDLIHCNIWGGYHVKSFCGANYVLTILNDASRGVWT